MGLTVGVGLLDDEDDAREDWYRAELDALNRALREHGLAEHRESWNPDWEPLSFDMFGYSGLHYLRRIAAHLDAGGSLPPPGDDSSADDPVLRSYYERLDTGGAGGGLLRRLRRREPPPAEQGRFDHLINHSDAEGYYVPQEFADVLHAPYVTGELVGSCHKLREELVELRTALEIPPGLDPESDALWQAADSEGDGERTWERYGVESFTCVRLLAACEASLERGVAIVFA